MTQDPLKKLPTSWLRRTIGAASSARALRRISSSNDPIAAEAAYKEFGALKGAVMKLGQMASYMQGNLSPAAQRTLARLQDAAPGIDAATVERVLFDNLGKPPERLFRAWSPVPVASASIGQVHQAVLHDGRRVAVKVQYPGVQKALESDLINVGLLSALSLPLAPHLDIAGLREEIRTHLLAECDYLAEAANQNVFAELFADRDDVLVPRAIEEFTTRQVLTTEWVVGKRFADFVTPASAPERNAVGAAMFSFAFESIFRHAMFNCDPHPGNYLIQDGARVAFLDFGCVKRFDREFLSGWRSLLLSALRGDRKRFDELVVSGGIVARPKKFDFDFHFRMSLELYRPFLADAPFRFTHEYIAQLSELLYDKNPNKRSASFPKDFVFVNRLQWGLYSLLATLEAECNWHRLLMNALDDSRSAVHLDPPPQPLSPRTSNGFSEGTK